MKKKIIESIWKNPGKTNQSIGIVAVDRSLPNQKIWCAYIGIVNGEDEETDEQTITDYGAKLSPEEAHGFFPNLSIEQYKK